MPTLHPEVLWAQRSSDDEPEKCYLSVTINLSNIKQDTLKFALEPTRLSFAATAGDASKGLEEKEYAFEFDFFKPIDVDASSRALTSRSLALKLRKADVGLEYWPRISKDKIKTNWLKTDFSKWVDEDEQDGVAAEDEPDPMEAMGGMGGMPGMGGMGGMPGMGGMGGPGGMGDMDIQKLLAQMGGAGGMGGLGGAGGSGAGGFGGGAGADDDDDDDDSDDDGPPPLEDAEPAK